MVEVMKEIRDEVREIRKGIEGGWKKAVEQARKTTGKREDGDDETEEKERVARDAEGSTPSQGNPEPVKVKEKERQEKNERRESISSWAGDVEKVNEEGRKEKEIDWKNEMEEREKKSMNVVVRGIEIGEGGKEREMEEWMGGILDREVRVNETEKGGGEEEKWWIVRMRDKRDREDILEKKEEIWRTQRVGGDKDLTFQERRNRWRMKDKAAKEKYGGKETIIAEKGVKIEKEWWIWKEREGKWEIRKEDREEEKKAKANEEDAKEKDNKGNGKEKRKENDREYRNEKEKAREGSGGTKKKGKGESKREKERKIDELMETVRRMMKELEEGEEEEATDEEDVETE